MNNPIRITVPCGNIELDRYVMRLKLGVASRVVGDDCAGVRAIRPANANQAAAKVLSQAADKAIGAESCEVL
jgi:hypothetical protein